MLYGHDEIKTFSRCRAIQIHRKKGEIMANKYVIDWANYAALARQAAAEGAVLLKNEREALPLQKGDKVSVFGRIQFHYYKSGTGSGGLVNTKYVVGILDALKEENDITLNGALEQVYREWIVTHPFDEGAGWAQEPWCQEEMPLTDELVKNAAEESNVALVVIGRTAGEDKDAGNEKGSYLLTDAEEDMLSKVCRAFERVVVVLNVGNIIDMNWVNQYRIGAVLYAWQGGMEGGHAVADVLLGRVNPCGKLADTIAYSIADYPSTPYFGGEHGDCYAEDIYVGYRYFETFAKEKVQYPFGFGLSYTHFSVVCDSLVRTEDGVRVQVTVTNVGNVAGKEVVQVYLNPPQGVLGKPLRNLAAFAKTKVLEAGESQTIELHVSDYQMASYDDSGVTGKKSCYVLEAGTYECYVGTDVRSAVLAGSFAQSQLKVVDVCTEALAPVEEFNRMKPQEKQGTWEVTWEKVPLRSDSMTARRDSEALKEIPYTGDCGYRLGDVYDGNVSLDDFVAQLSEEDLCCIVRGEGMCSPKVTPGTAAAFGGVTEHLQSFGIPCACCSDGPSGIRMDCGTNAFSMPNGTCLACTFNEELSERLYQMEGAELRKNRIDTLLGPGMNLHRNPLNGRNFEYFSEDPFLTGKMAAAQVRGMNHYQVTGTIKHFIANNQEYHRNRCNSVVSERALREIYLKGFEIAVKEGDAYSIMTTYGAVNGLWTASNYDLLTTILRGEWKFEGLVMTDWCAEMNDEGEEPSRANTAAMVAAQNDIYMIVPDSLKNPNHDNLAERLADGRLNRLSLVRCAKNILTFILRSAVMERSLGRISEEEKQAYESMQDEDKVDFDMTIYQVVGKTELDISKLDTRKGSSNVYAIQTERPTNCLLRMTVTVDGGELAQVPVSIFSNGTLQRTVTLFGTNGESAEIEQEIGGMMGTTNYIKLYFAQNGMHVEKMTIEPTEVLKLPWME